jgi:hypothetical protein
VATVITRVYVASWSCFLSVRNIYSRCGHAINPVRFFSYGHIRIILPTLLDLLLGARTRALLCPLVAAHPAISLFESLDHLQQNKMSIQSSASQVVCDACLPTNLCLVVSTSTSIMVSSFLSSLGLVVDLRNNIVSYHLTCWH